MDILRSVTQTVLGNQSTGNQPTGVETIERLLDRVQSSTLLEDRRNGCRALRSLSKKYRLYVGAHGMDTLIQVLESDRNDHEIVNLALETLVNVMSDEVFTEEGEELKDDGQADIGKQFTEIFTKRPENISMIISLLDEFDFKVRFPAMKLLNNMLKNRPKEIQEEILVIPSAISKLMDMLSDSREVVRNDTLLLLNELAKGNTSLQKIVAFENAFDHLFEIIKAEGYAEGDVVVQDCLILTCNLLKNNPSNQTLFKEGNYIQKMTEFFELPLDNNEPGWTAQKVANVHYMMKLVCALVSPHNSAQLILECQKKMIACGLIEKLCRLLMAVGVPADILTDTIIATSEVIRGNKDNQEFFLGVTAPSNPPRPAIVVLLLSMVNEKQPFRLRCAVLYCFECVLYRNPASQSQIVKTLLPQTADASQITAGQLLCGGLFSGDAVSNWFSAVALSHALLDNTALKETLLRVQLATPAGGPPVSLLQRCTSVLQSGSKLLTRLGVLQLLCVWVSYCPIVVGHLLSLPTLVPHLTAYLSANEHDEMEVLCQGVCAFLLGLCGYFNDGSVANFTKDALALLISNRVGVETFTDKMESLLRTEAYSRAAKSPCLNAKQPSDIVFDMEFTKLFKNLEASALKAISKSEQNTHEELSAEISNYKSVIRDQDAEIRNINELLSKRETQLDQQNKELQDLHLINSNGQSVTSNGIGAQPPVEAAVAQVTLLEKQLHDMTYARDYYYYQMVEKDNMVQKMAQTNGTGVNGTEPSLQESAPNPQLENLQQQLQDLQLALYKKDEEMQSMREAANKNDRVAPPEMPSEETKNLQFLLSEANLTKDHLQQELVRFKDELEKQQSSQEDLLILLTDQDAKVRLLKNQLRQLGQELSEDDEDDSLDDQNLL